MKEAAGLRLGSQTLAAWCVTAPNKATASSPWTIRNRVVMKVRSPTICAVGCTFPHSPASVSPYNARMLGLVVSTIAFFVASYFIKRYLDRSEEHTSELQSHVNL